MYVLSIYVYVPQTMPSMPNAVDKPLVVQHLQYIYVLGGNINRYVEQQSVSQYNMADSTWKQCSDMPVACTSDKAGVVEHGGTIKVITQDRCLLYADDTDTWTVQQYDDIGEYVNVFVKRGQIWAATEDDNDFYNDNRSYSILSYDDVNNEWKTEKENIKNVWYTRFFL